jgi:hypothetical protein
VNVREDLIRNLDFSCKKPSIIYLLSCFAGTTDRQPSLPCPHWISRLHLVQQLDAVLPSARLYDVTVMPASRHFSRFALVGDWSDLDRGVQAWEDSVDSAYPFTERLTTMNPVGYRTG